MSIFLETLKQQTEWIDLMKQIRSVNGEYHQIKGLFFSYLKFVQFLQFKQ